MRIILIGFFLFLSFLSRAQGTFQKLYSCFSEGSVRYLVQCSDSGFIFSAGENLIGLNLFKTDSIGSVEWVYAFPYACVGYNVFETYDHHFIVSGFRNENSGYRLAPFILKISSSGSLIWSRGYNVHNLLASNFSVPAAAQPSDSGYFLMSALPLSWNEIPDIVVIKTDSSGNAVWNRQYGGTGSEWGITLIKARPSGYIIYGYTDSFGPASRMIFKIDESGIVQWARLVGSGFLYPAGEPIQQTNDNGYIFIGGGINSSSICKLDSSGNFLWAKDYTSIFDLTMQSSVQTSDGGIAVSGYLNDSIGNHAFVVKLDSVGDAEWTKYFNDSVSNSTGAYTLVQTFDGGFAFSGRHDDLPFTYLVLVKTDSLGNLSCPGSSIPGFQSNFISNPVSLITLNSQLISLSDSSVSSNYNNLPYSETPFCFAPVNTSIDELAKSAITISPNPFHTSSTLRIKSNTSVYVELKIYNTLGSLVRTEQILTVNTYILHRNSLPEGIYFYRLNSPFHKVLATGKFIIE